MTEIVDDELRELWLSVGALPNLLLTGENIDENGNAYTIEALADDATWGSPVPIDVSVQRWMTDGAVSSTQGHENREISFRVVVSAATSMDLAAGEAALAKRSGQAGTLSWVSHEGAPEAPTTVFEVWTLHLEHALDDLDEFQLQRAYTVRITAKPWVRSENLTTAVAPIPPLTSTTFTIDDCTTATSWEGSPVGVVASGGAVKVSFNGAGAYNVDLTRTGLVTGMDVTPYLMIDISSVGDQLGPNRVQPFLYLDGGSYLTAVAQLGTVYYFKVPTGMTSFTKMRVHSTFNFFQGNTTMTWSVADVSRTDTIGSVGSFKQLSRRLEVGGSVKTSGSIQLASPSATPLGTCLVYTTPDTRTGFSSAMRPYRTTGNTVTPDTSCVSGNREAFVNAGATAGDINYTLPAGTPEATYVVVGRFLFGAAATMTVFFTSRIGTAAGNFSTPVTATGAGVVWAVLGAIPAPWMSLPPESGVTPQFQAAGTATTGTHTLDELYLFDITHGSLTLMQGNPGTRLWIDAPDANPTRDRPALYIGTQPDRSDAFTPVHSTILSLGDHDLDPDGVTLFTVTDGVDKAAASASFYHRWHTHAGD